VGEDVASGKKAGDGGASEFAGLGLASTSTASCVLSGCMCSRSRLRPMSREREGAWVLTWHLRAFADSSRRLCNIHHTENCSTSDPQRDQHHCYLS
jgi:hypothetical protein